jgi:hypothetical protein
MWCSSEDSVQVYFWRRQDRNMAGLTASRDKRVRVYGHLGLRVLETYAPDYGDME